MSNRRSAGSAPAHGTNYHRLATVKATYDPTDLLHVNHHIQPTGEKARN